MNYGPPSNIVFRETCDVWDTSKWSQTWNPPSVVDGTWVFNFPAGVIRGCQAVRLDMSGYGLYRVRFRTNGPSVAGANYWIFLYYAPDGDYTPTANELDFMEIYGSAPYPSEFVETFWRNGTGGGGAGMGGITYWYVDPPINWEDGNWHQWEAAYTSKNVNITVDDIRIFSHTERQSVNYDVQPLPPMQFMIGGGTKFAPTSPFQFIIDEIEYRKPVG